MSEYKPPLNDMSFVLHDMFHVEDFLTELQHPAELDEALCNAIIEEAGRLCAQVLAPINRKGDEQGCSLTDKGVRTPDGFKAAYRQFFEAGWPAFTASPAYGGQGMPKTLHVLLDEMLHASNSSFCLYASLTSGAVHALEHHASEPMKATWLPPLIEGRWTGTMCLTEAHAGTDLGLIKTRAIKNEDDSYLINGTKIFITGGEHDLSENIIHLVLARLPDAPAGVKGISMFIVPRFLLDGSGNPTQANAVSCGALEHKMGIKASATCVMNFDDARGYLVGEKNQGLKYMFSMMNNERLSIGIQGIGLADSSLQTAADYARERLQSRAPIGSKGGPDPIVEQPDVRRMLLWMRSHTEAARMSAVWLGMKIDNSELSTSEEDKFRSSKLVAFLTPVAKAFYTDMGSVSCNLGMQILGGHGYIREWGQEQYVRDVRIAQIYEGTNGIQAMDLIGRKLLMDKGEGFQIFAHWYNDTINQAEKINKFQIAEPENFFSTLKASQQSLLASVQWLLQQCQQRPALAASVATDLLELTGLCWFAGMWCLALNALEKAHYLNNQQQQQKTVLAEFFVSKVLIKHATLKSSIMAGEQSVMALDAELM